MSDETPKIIIDDDWKSSAQAEKAKLAEKEAQRAAEQADSGSTSGIPEQVGFRELLSMLATQALMYMGAFPDESGRAMVALDIAKLNIDLLAVLEEKTKGNLDQDEAKMLGQTLTELRFQFVEVSKAVAKAQQEGTLEHMNEQPNPFKPGS
jgi:hypothetical protein